MVLGTYFIPDAVYWFVLWLYLGLVVSLTICASLLFPFQIFCLPLYINFLLFLCII